MTENNMETITGSIEDIRDKQTSTGKTQKIVEIGGVKISFWPNLLSSDLKKGDQVTIEYEVNGQWKNGKTAKRAGVESVTNSIVDVSKMTPEQIQDMANKAKAKADADKLAREANEKAQHDREFKAREKEAQNNLRIYRCCFLNNAAELVNGSKVANAEGKTIAQLTISVAADLEKFARDAGWMKDAEALP